MNAVSGLLEVQLVGLKCDIDVEIVQLSDFVFGCSYVPELSGELFVLRIWMLVCTRVIRLVVCSSLDSLRYVDHLIKTF